jgi:uracil-DNA glycosylase
VLLHEGLNGIETGGRGRSNARVPGYVDECLGFMAKQIEIVRPCALIALGAQSAKYLNRLNFDFVELKRRAAGLSVHSLPGMIYCMQKD